MDLSQYAELGEDAHINLRSFRSDGSAVDTPVWFIVEDQRYFLRTVSHSAKIHRILREPGVQLAACQWDGELTGPWRTGTARVLADDDPRITNIDAAMQAKYGEYRSEMTQLMASLNKPLCFVEITLLD